MEAYFLFRWGAGTSVPEAAAVCEEQLEDIGSPSDSESTSRDSAGTSSEIDDDGATSSSFSSDSRSHRGSETASVLTQLPIKRGLSRFFDGKSQSFASLQAVSSLEDLAKPPPKRLKLSRSCGGGLDARRGRRLSPPKAAAGAKEVVVTTGSLAVLGAATRRSPLAVPARPEGVASKVLVVS